MIDNNNHLNPKKVNVFLYPIEKLAVFWQSNEFEKNLLIRKKVTNKYLKFFLDFILSHWPKEGDKEVLVVNVFYIFFDDLDTKRIKGYAVRTNLPVDGEDKEMVVYFEEKDLVGLPEGEKFLGKVWSPSPFIHFARR